MKRDIGFSKSRGKSKLTFEKKTKSELRFKKEKTKIEIENGQNVMSWVIQIAIVIMVALVVVIYFGQRVSVVGDSMNPVLSNKDVVLVNRIVYDASQPKRGDIIVFKPNGNENASYSVKRIIGLPGEKIQITDGVVYINGEKLKESYDTAAITDAGVAAEEMELGGSEYFVMGDNRAASDDSRQADIGNVKRREIYGKVWFTISGDN